MNTLFMYIIYLIYINIYIYISIYMYIYLYNSMYSSIRNVINANCLNINDPFLFNIYMYI